MFLILHLKIYFNSICNHILILFPLNFQSQLNDTYSNTHSNKNLKLMSIHDSIQLSITFKDIINQFNAHSSFINLHSIQHLIILSIKIKFHFITISFLYNYYKPIFTFFHQLLQKLQDHSNFSCQAKATIIP